MTVLADRVKKLQHFKIVWSSSITKTLIIVVPGY
jgi:hypothetical protein